MGSRDIVQPLLDDTQKGVAKGVASAALRPSTPTCTAASVANSHAEFTPQPTTTANDDGCCQGSDAWENSLVKSKLMQACAICAVFMVVEVVCGIISNSLALITDASHMLSDLSSFLISLFALWASSQPGTSKHSFGFYRAEILGACISVLLIWVVTGYLVVEAIHRVVHPQPVNGRIMMFTAIFGTAANVVMTFILGFHSHGIGGHHDHDHHHELEAPHDGHDAPCGQRRKVDACCSIAEGDDAADGGATAFPLADDLESAGDARLAAPIEVAHRDSTTCVHKEQWLQKIFHNETAVDDTPHAVPQLTDTQNGCSANLNLRAAYLHALGDLIQNIGVIIAATIIWVNPRWTIADPICTFIFSILVAITTFSIISEAMNVLMEGTPVGIDLTALRCDIMRIPAVTDLHDLHVWSLSVGKPSLACHIVVDEERSARRVLRVATHIVQKKYSILHTTIQVDFSQNKSACDTDAHVRCH